MRLSGFSGDVWVKTGFLTTACCSPLSLSSCAVSIHKASQESNSASKCRLNDHKFQEKMCNCPISAILWQATLWIKATDYGSSLSQLLNRFHKDPSLRCSHSKQLSENTEKQTQWRLFFCFWKFKRLFGLSIFVSFHDVTLESHTHTFASNWKTVTGT